MNYLVCMARRRNIVLHASVHVPQGVRARLIARRLCRRQVKNECALELTGIGYQLIKVPHELR
jgi:hypothetical protein